MAKSRLQTTNDKINLIEANLKMGLKDINCPLAQKLKKDTAKLLKLAGRKNYSLLYPKDYYALAAASRRLKAIYDSECLGI